MKRSLGATVKVLGFLVCGLAPVVAQASTVGYWRFEEGNYLGDSGPNSLTLVSSGTTTQVATPFPNPVPQTGQTNGSAADLGSTQDGHFGFVETVANEISVSDFTIEAYIRMEAADTSFAAYFASEWTDPGLHGWAFGMGEGSGSRAQGELILLLNSSSNSVQIIESNLALLIEQNKDYYVAASFDESNTASGVTFYIENLTDNTSATVSVGHSTTTLNKPQTTFRIGTINNATDRRFPGLIDEVRLSDVVLDSSALLNSSATAIPVPAALPAGLMMMLLVGGGRHRPRHC